MDISIIIPVYNSENHLCRCLDSISGQDFSSYEVILVDDGSTDSSPSICDRYVSSDPRFRMIRKSNGGVSSARNAGLSVAEGDYVMFVDSDDALSPGALDAFATGLGADFMSGGFNIYDEGVFSLKVTSGVSRSYGKDGLASFFDDVMPECGELFRGPWAKLFRRSVINEHSICFNERLSYAEDKLFVYEFLCHIGSAVSLDVPVYEYYRHPGSLSGGKTTRKRVSQLLDVIPLCSEAMSRLAETFPSSKAIPEVYHNDLVCCDVMRVLRFFLKCCSPSLTEDNLKSMYRVLSGDRLLTVSENRVRCQRINVMLYRMGSVRISMIFYRIVSRIISVLHV